MKSNTAQPWLSRFKASALQTTSLLVASALALTALSGCLKRPIGESGPRTTNILVDLISQNVVDKVDMLFVIDNSLSMRDKQAILIDAVPDLVSRFVSPVCLDVTTGAEVLKANDGSCPNNAAPEFNAINDIHIGVITTSLGGFGAVNCQEDPARPFTAQMVDMAHLVGSLPRTNGAGGAAFLTWTGGNQDRVAFEESFKDQVAAAGEQGCGWEASLEAWVRFLVDPFPYTRVLRRDCTAGDGQNACAGPETDAAGVVQTDTTLLAQRQQFLRLDSLLAVIMLTDENDCSFKASGQAWILADTSASGAQGAAKGSTTCLTDPNSACCQSCQVSRVADNCPSEVDANGATRPQGCSDPFYAPTPSTVDEPADDQPNLRCFHQKARFGVDFLYPVQRYANALTLKQICPSADDLDPANCKGDVFSNPVFTDGTTTRSASLVFMGGIVGVPWQDLAIDPAAPVLQYKKAVQGDNDPPNSLINWDWLIGDVGANGKRALYPTGGNLDPLMQESVEPRTGNNPATGEALAPPGSGSLANSINGHEWDILSKADLQYACIFPLPEATVCPSYDQWTMDVRSGVEVPNCDCTFFGGDEYGTPLCQDQVGNFDYTQRYAKAYPSIRPLQALELFSQQNPEHNAIVASICPKEATDKNAADYGYRPAVATIVDRLKEQLQEPCLPRPLGKQSDGSAACVIVQATTDPEQCAVGRDPVAPDIDSLVRGELQSQTYCGGKVGPDCSTFSLCTIPQVKPDAPEYVSCITGGAGGNGWCYVDPDSAPMGQEAAVEAAVAKCPATQKRKLRFVGTGQPGGSSLTFFACSGALFDTAE